MYRLYKDHVDRLYWGRLYLNPRFFELVAQRLRRNLCFVVAEREGTVIAGTFNVQKSGVFYGRYWGAFEEVPFLHFNVCYYAAIEHCIDTGLKRMEPGAGGDFKQLRGFDPRPTRSMHHFTHPALRDAVARHLERERARMGLIIDHLNEQSQLKAAVRQTGE
jgi:predicted N-acyltransferase